MIKVDGIQNCDFTMILVLLKFPVVTDNENCFIIGQGTVAAPPLLHNISIPDYITMLQKT